MTPQDSENERVSSCHRKTFCSKAKKRGDSRDVPASSRTQHFSR